MPGRLVDQQPSARGRRQPFVARKLQVCNDVELNPGPNRKNGGSPKKSVSRMSVADHENDNNVNNGDKRDLMPANNVPRVKKLGEVSYQAGIEAEF